MKKLRLHAPGLQVEIIATNEASDLRKREADIAIRNFEPDHAELIARKLEKARAHLYATPDYIQKLPKPVNKEALQSADFVGFTNNAPIIEALQHAAIPITESNFPLITESHLVHWEIVKSGAAIGIMSELIGDQEPSVERVLPEMEPFIFETWLVVHREVRTNRKVRLVFDFLIEEFKALSLAK
jgi:DNA-binding transcriptional LysR family regulator